MKITKTIVRTYNIYDCAKWGMTIGDTVKRRERAGIKTAIEDKCFVCGYKFKFVDFPNLALIRNHTNEFVCEKCARKIKESIKNDKKVGEEND